MQAAADLFIAQGYGAVSMDAIARAAGVSKATLYAYFTSKDRLFETIISDACAGSGNFQELLSTEADALPEDDPRSTLMMIGNRLMRFFLQDDVLRIQRVVIAEAPRFPELGRAYYDGGPVVGRCKLAEWIARQAEAGHLFVDDPVQAADQFMTLLRGDLFVRCIVGLEVAPTEAQMDEAVVGIVDMFMRAYGRPPGGTGALTKVAERVAA